MELNRQSRAIPIKLNKTDKDDVIGNICLYLCQHKDIATDIYENKKTYVLYRMFRLEVYSITGKRKFRDKMEFSRFQRIIAICNKYDIQPIPENAYKISVLLDNGDANFNISGIVSILKTAEPFLNGYRLREVSLNDFVEYKLSRNKKRL